VLNWQAACLVDFLELRKEEARTLSQCRLPRLFPYRHGFEQLYQLQTDIFVGEDERHLLCSVTTDFDS
jgi:hypothetical protein